MADITSYHAMRMRKNYNIKKQRRMLQSTKKEMVRDDNEYFIELSDGKSLKFDKLYGK